MRLDELPLACPHQYRDASSRCALLAIREFAVYDVHLIERLVDRQAPLQRSRERIKVVGCGSLAAHLQAAQDLLRLCLQLRKLLRGLLGLQPCADAKAEYDQHGNNERC